MVTFSNSIVIRRPLAEVWDFLMRLENYPLWQAGVLSVSGSDGTRLGSRLAVETFNLGRKLKLNAIVTENDGVGRYTAKSVQGPLTFISTYRLEPVEGGTQLDFICEIDTHAVFNLAAPALEAVGRAKNEADLASLKILLEHEPALEQGAQ